MRGGRVFVETNNQAVITEYKAACINGAVERVKRIYEANPDLQKQFDAVNEEIAATVIEQR